MWDMKTSARTRAAGRKRKEPVASDRLYDVIGVLLFACGLILLIGLIVGDAGALGGALTSAVLAAVGKGAWLVPVVLCFSGLSVIRGQRSMTFTQLACGFAILLAVVAAFAAQKGNGDYFDPYAATGSGGYLGAGLAWAFEGLFGAAKGIGLGALGMVGLVLCVNAPLRVIGQTLAERAKAMRRPQRAVTPRKAVRVHPPIEEDVDDEEDVEAPNVTRPVIAKTKPLPAIKETVQLKLGLEEPTPKEGYQLPPTTMLAASSERYKRTPEEMQQNIDTLEGTLEQFGIDANVVEVATGPTVTRYEIQLGPGIRVARITALADNIAMDLAASHVRVEAPIPGKAAIGVEVPNAQAASVSLRECVETKDFRDHPSRLAVALGHDVSGALKVADLARMPHLLIGGATNSGKSIGLASIIMSILMRNTPKDVKFVMIDPKRVELSLFDGIPHLLCPVVKDVKEAPGVLRAVWREMDRRYDKFSEAGVRNIDGWNAKASFQDRMSYIVVVIDELADMMIQAAAEVETSICRLAQLARATGIHLVIATQRPSVDVITGTIKANISSRIAFAVASHIDSKTILDQPGAERLIGRGDMLYLPIDASKPVRVQGCYVSEKDIEAVCSFWKEQEKPQYAFVPSEVAHVGGGDRDDDESDNSNDPLWEESVRWVADRGQASTSMLQRRFSIGFQRASRLLDTMEERGIVGPREGSRPREVLIDPMYAETMFGGVYDGPGADERDAREWD